MQMPLRGWPGAWWWRTWWVSSPGLGCGSVALACGSVALACMMLTGEIGICVSSGIESGGLFIQGTLQLTGALLPSLLARLRVSFKRSDFSHCQVDSIAGQLAG